MNIQLFQVDAFSHEPFSGNPAAVCLLDSPIEDLWMINIAREMNLSETAFLLPEADGFRLRWFTPTKEVSLCGHATLASAHILWESGILPPNSIAKFFTLSGLLTAQKNGDWIALNFPVRIVEETPPPPGLLAALGIANPNYVGKYKQIYLIEVESENTLRSLHPNFERVKELSVRSVIVTSRSETAKFDFVSRYFAPTIGVNEDPVTGSAHCVLTPYWEKKIDKTEFVAYQASSRGGVLKVSLAGDRIILQGEAVTILEGKIKLNN